MQKPLDVPKEETNFLVEIRNTYPSLRAIKPAEWSLVEAAYTYADEVFHSGQFRHNGEPYLMHIKRSVINYLRMLGDNPCDYRYLVALILHDSFEDHKTALTDIANDPQFPSAVFIMVLWMTKPKPHVLTQVQELSGSNRALYNTIKQKGFEDFYFLMSGDGLDLMKGKITKAFAWGDVRHGMKASLESIGEYFQALINEGVENVSKIQAEYAFLLLVICMPDQIFRLKVAERMDNLDDIKGLIERKSIDSARKMLRTSEVYHLRLVELGWITEDRNFKTLYDSAVKLLESADLNAGIIFPVLDNVDQVLISAQPSA